MTDRSRPGAEAPRAPAHPVKPAKKRRRPHAADWPRWTDVPVSRLNYDLFDGRGRLLPTWEVSG